MYENQRYQPGAEGWGSRYPGHLLPTDRSKFTDETGYKKPAGKIKELELIEPPEGFVWKGDWIMDTDWTVVDEEGFHYAFDMYQLSKSFKSGKVISAKNANTHVRRRKWKRLMIPEPIKLSSVCEVATGMKNGSKNLKGAPRGLRHVMVTLFYPDPKGDGIKPKKGLSKADEKKAKSKLKDINLMCMDEFSRNRLVIGMMALLEDQTRRELSNGIQVSKLSSMTDQVSEPRYLYLKLGQDGRQYLSWSVPDDYVIEVFENQRHQPGAGGWGSSYPGHLLPSDRSRFTDEGGYNFKRSFTGNKSKVDLKDMVPRPGWSWEGAWTVDKQWTEVDEEGWHYASDMWVLSQTFHAGRTYSKATGCYARRKRWVRKMKDADVSLSNIKAVLTGLQTKVTKKLGKKKKVSRAHGRTHFDPLTLST